MDKDLAMKWVDALRSGKYEQGKERLRTLDDKFCCLGVLANIENLKWSIDKNNEYICYGIDGHRAQLPPYIESKVFKNGSSQGLFVMMNDAQDKSFNEIADYIEANWETI